MTDVQDASASSEPSMEEILASIRRIIADEKDPNAAADAGGDEIGEGSKEDVLELTQIVQDDGTIADARDFQPEPVAPAPEPEPQAAPIVDPFAFDPVPAAPMQKEEADGLLSNLAATAATSSLTALANTVSIEKRASLHGITPLGNMGRSLEDLVVELMRPMLKDWLDQNLPPIVERIVQKEVERIARRVPD